MSTMEEFSKRVEKDMAVPNLPQFATKEEIIEYARKRLADKRNRAITGVIQGATSTGSPSEDTVRSNQGDSGGGAANSTGAGAERGTQAYPVYAGDGRDAPGTGSSDGYSNNSPVGDRVNAGGGAGPDQYDRSASGLSEPAVYAPSGGASSRKGLGSGFRSKMKTYASAAFAPIDKPKAAKAPTGTRRGASEPVPPSSKKWRPLSSEEAAKLYPKLVEYITWQSEYLDQFIIATTKGHDPTIEIWSNLDKAEIEILADYLIQRGRSDGTTAQAVRFASVLLDRVKVALIVLPRAYSTVNLYLVRGFDLSVFMRR